MTTTGDRAEGRPDKSAGSRGGRRVRTEGGDRNATKARTGTSLTRPGKSRLLTGMMLVYLVYTLVPLVWLLISTTKTQNDLLSTPGLWPGHSFAFFSNIKETLTYRDGIFLRWLANTLLYVVVGAGGATLLATAAGYGLAKYRFPGRRAVFAVVLGAIAIPPTALAVPTFLMFSNMALTNTVWAIIVPSLISPFGLYLMWVYAEEAVPQELLEAARIDGAGEFRIFWTVSLRLLAPGVVTVLLFAVVSTWNNYFLPLIMLSKPNLYPLTVGLTQWSNQAHGAGAHPVYNLVVTGSLLTIVPLIVVFFLLQRFWQSGLSAGSVKQ
jgi:multiple sugar transport system permease protein